MNTTKFAFSVTLGAAYWLLAALFVRAFGSFFFTGNTPGLLVLYAASVPGTWLLIQNARWLGRLAPAEVLDAVVVMTWTAAVLDGVAITFFGWVYGTSAQVVMLGAAWILWGAGWGLGVAYWMKRNVVKRSSNVPAATAREGVKVNVA
jgi:hypothetical protein